MAHSTDRCDLDPDPVHPGTSEGFPDAESYWAACRRYYADCVAVGTADDPGVKDLDRVVAELDAVRSRLARWLDRYATVDADNTGRDRHLKLAVVGDFGRVVDHLRFLGFGLDLHVDLIQQMLPGGLFPESHGDLDALLAAAGDVEAEPAEPVGVRP
jgi:hypothetical protein